ncbi:hypothetical protein Dimus_010074 [Dionaea muscipula]
MGRRKKKAPLIPYSQWTPIVQGLNFDASDVCSENSDLETAIPLEPLEEEKEMISEEDSVASSNGDSIDPNRDVDATLKIPPTLLRAADEPPPLIDVADASDATVDAMAADFEDELHDSAPNLEFPRTCEDLGLYIPTLHPNSEPGGPQVNPNPLNSSMAMNSSVNLIPDGRGKTLDLPKLNAVVVKEFYARLTMTHYKKKEVARSSVRGVDIAFGSERLTSILSIPGNNGICEYIKEVWEESKYTKPLEITRKFANDNTIIEARRVRSIEIKSFQRFIHFLVMKNVVPQFGKRDTTSYMDLIYMDHIVSRRLVNLPRVMMRHMSYVISVKNHELPYRDWMTMIFEAFDVPLVDKQGEEPKRYDYFEETFLTIDDEDIAPAEEVNDEEEEQNQPDFDWEAVVDEAALQEESGSDDQFFYAQVEVKEPTTKAPAIPVFPASPEDSTNVQKEPAIAGVDPSAPTGSISDAIFSSLQADFERARANRI